MFYVYEWFIKNTGEIIYVGKGSIKRSRSFGKRGKLFAELYKRFDCESRIIKEFENEDDAFDYEFKYTRELKHINQAVCNQIYSGNGGSSNWTDSMKNRMSEFNPMKDENQKERMSKLNPMKRPEQRQRMSEQNPMKNPEYAKASQEKHKRPVIIDGIRYESVKEAALKLNVTSAAISYRCKHKDSCKYDNQQPSLACKD